jgi:hypothetical protein
VYPHLFELEEEREDGEAGTVERHAINSLLFNHNCICGWKQKATSILKSSFLLGLTITLIIGKCFIKGKPRKFLCNLFKHRNVPLSIGA